jgi:hypothetical protein
MSEHITDGTSPTTPKLDADVIPLPVHAVRGFSGKHYTPEGTLELQRTEIWSERDATMSEDEVASVVESLNAGKLMVGVDKTDRPLALMEWILRESHVTLDWKPLAERHTAHAKVMADLEKRRLLNPEAKLTAKEKLIVGLTQYEQRQMAIGQGVTEEVKVAVADLHDIKRTLEESDDNVDGITLLDVLDGYENVMRPKIAKSNPIRIYNKLYDKLHAPDSKRPSPDLIIAGRIMLMFMKNRLEPTDRQP